MNVTAVADAGLTDAPRRSHRREDRAFADAMDEAATAAREAVATEEARRAIAGFDLSRPADAANAAAYAEAARQVSAAQGLSAGSHDFTRITPRQMTIVGGAMVAGGDIDARIMAGALRLARSATAADAPVNFIAYLEQQAGANEKTPGGMTTAFEQRAALAVLKRTQSERGLAITYDDNYPTAPRAMTMEEATARLKAAIAAFEKEASLTPAQRIRRDVMKEMSLTTDDLKAMSPADRELAETKIGDEVRRRLELAGLSALGAKGGAPDEASTAQGAALLAG